MFGYWGHPSKDKRLCCLHVRPQDKNFTPTDGRSSCQTERHRVPTGIATEYPLLPTSAAPLSMDSGSIAPDGSAGLVAQSFRNRVLHCSPNRIEGAWRTSTRMVAQYAEHPLFHQNSVLVETLYQPVEGWNRRPLDIQPLSHSPHSKSCERRRFGLALGRVEAYYDRPSLLSDGRRTIERCRNL